MINLLHKNCVKVEARQKMEKFLQWMIKHKVSTAIIAIALFFVPLLVIHILFLWNSGIDWMVARWTPGDLMGYVAGFEAFIGTVALGALALWQNQQIHNQHIESLEPILSMRLILIKGMLYLTIENTGLSEAKDIQINVERIENNGENDLLLDALFDNSFELFPHETVQGRVAISGKNSMTQTFPKISVHVSYVRVDINRKREYSRTVLFDGGYSQRIVADVNMDNRKINSDVDCIARAVLRVANYLDGHQVRKIDELDIWSSRSLHNDLVSAINTAEETPIVNRKKGIKKSTKRKKGSEDAKKD